MKQLNIAEMNLVAGGDYELTLSLHVPSSVANQMADLIQGITTGQFTDTASVAGALSAAGPVLNEVRVTTISFSDFN